MTDGYIISFLSLCIFFCFIAMCGGGNKAKKNNEKYQTIACSTPNGWATYEAKDLLVGGSWRFTTKSNKKIIASHCFLGVK